MAERNFKGVWIPREVWLDKKLTLIEKGFLVEIDSLDNNNGCYASNSYFAEFFGMHATNVSRTIKKLKEKQYVNIRYEYKAQTKEIKKRFITLNRPPYPIDNRCYHFDKGVLSKCDGGGYQNAKGSNTSFSNTKDIKKLLLTSEEANEIYSHYPRKEGKKDGIKKLMKLKPSEATKELIIEKVKQYAKSVEGKDKTYIALFSTWCNKERWQDDYITESKQEAIKWNPVV